LVVADPINPVADLTETGGLPYYRGFFERLPQLGFVEGQNLDIKRGGDDAKIILSDPLLCDTFIRCICG
jgi:hypothetical protein